MKILSHKTFAVSLLLCALIGLPIASPVQAQNETPVVHAVLFYSPTCPHCEHVIKEDIPPLYEKYGSQLQIIGVNTLESEGWALYRAAAEQFSIPEDRRGVPTLIVGETVLVGSEEVRNEFPGLIEDGLASDGVAVPNIPELLALLPTPEPAATTSPAAEAAPPAEASDSTELAPQIASDSSVVMPTEQSLSPKELFARDPAGNTLAVIVLIGMIASVGYVAVEGRHAKNIRNPKPVLSPAEVFEIRISHWLVPVFALIGLGVASYMTYVETLQVEAICGPIGDCNTVQQSEYARILGVLPIGVLGAIGYVAILAVWAWQRIEGTIFATLALFGMAAFGTLFSIYLTFLEPFVIGATCAWCLSSAVIITALLLLTARPGLQAVQALRTKEKGAR